MAGAEWTQVMRGNTEGGAVRKGTGNQSQRLVEHGEDVGLYSE